MFWKMISKILLRQKSKMFMVAFTIAVGVSLSTAMINVMLGVGDKVNRELKVYGANINVMPKGASLLGDLYGIEDNDEVNAQYLKENEIFNIKKIFWGFNIVDFAPFLSQSVKYNGEDIKIVGTWVQKKEKMDTGEEIDTGMQRLRNWWSTSLQGEWLGQNDDDSVMVGSLLAGKNNIKLGDNIELIHDNNKKILKVKAIYTDGGKMDEQVVATLKTTQELTSQQGKISNIEVSALTTPDNDLAKKAAQDPNGLTPDEYETWYCTAYVSAICHQIQEVITDGVAKPVRQVAESEGTILNKTKLLMLLITILSSLGSALAISNLITASVMERRQEIGLIKAIGAYDWIIIMLVIMQVLITGIVGSILGYFIGIGFAQIIGLTVFGSTIELSAMVIPIVGVIVVSVIILGSIPAIRYLLNLKPTEVLHGK